MAADARASPAIPSVDELLFIALCFPRKWVAWSLARAITTGRLAPAEAMAAWSALPADARFASRRRTLSRPEYTRFEFARVSVVLPTIDRYPYLNKAIDGLRRQTVQPLEILVVDQSTIPEDISAAASGLPLTLMRQPTPGQCASRNRALMEAKGDYFLFLDDDVTLPPDLIERHLATLQSLGADACVGRVDELGSPLMPESERHVQVADGFPGGNTLVKREALLRSGLFDMAYDQRPRADGDLGMRVYLSGALIVYDPRFGVLHHRAPRGGLRTHGVRAQTASSRKQTIKHLNLPNASELYLATRYFSPEQAREALWLRATSTLFAGGSRFKRLSKLGYGLAALPHTVAQIKERGREAELMAETFPQIPDLPDDRSLETHRVAQNKTHDPV